MSEAVSVEVPVNLSTTKKLASRRFIVALFSIVIASALIAAGKLDPSTFENIVIWISGIYIIGKPFGDRVGEFLNRAAK